jgi:GNAT superfamily N-acetyltransferase
MDFIIRTLSSDHDTDLFVRMEFESARENRAVDTARPEEEVFAEHRQELLDFIASKTKTGIFLAEKDSQPAGFIWVSVRGQMEPWDLDAPPAWIYDVRVSPEFRGQGLGKKLLQHAEEWAQGEGLSRIGLHVFGFNQIARRLYQSSNYQMLNCYFQKQLSQPAETVVQSDNRFAFRTLETEADRQSLHDLSYRRFSTSATAHTPVDQKALEEKHQALWQTIPLDKSTEYICLAEDQNRSLAGFAWAYPSQSDLGDRVYVWVRYLEADPAYTNQQFLLNQLLTQVQTWAFQNGLDTIRLDTHFSQTDLIKVLQDNAYQKTNLFLQKKLLEKE